MFTATDTHATIEELLKAVFSVWSMPKLYITRTSVSESESAVYDKANVDIIEEAYVRTID
jgi:hypothetical protein